MNLFSYEENGIIVRPVAADFMELVDEVEVDEKELDEKEVEIEEESEDYDEFGVNLKNTFNTQPA